ncbi:hypothetical protein FRC10_003675 [Ceratobasidium sp. 414]|nr:hypothetical protein FRC10_003675 [Ceratobasidium sp. 414]
MECTYNPFSYQSRFSDTAGFLRDIAFTAREPDVHLVISNALHGGDFIQFGTEPINFELRLHRNRRGGGLSHGGTGLLTLPEEGIGKEFLRRYGYGGADKLVVNSRQIQISPSKYDVRQDTVERLRLTSYRDPQSEAEKKLAARAEELSESIPLVKIEQGWTKRNSRFLSEYIIEPNDIAKDLSLHFEDEDRQMKLEVETGNGLFSMNPVFQIRFRYSDIDQIIIDRHSEINTILFRLRNPVSYESCKGDLQIQLDNVLNPGKRPTRTRLSSFELDEKHAEVAEYISRDILIRLARPAASDFLRLSKIARLPEPQWRILSVVQSNMFSPDKILGLRQWITKHTWEVAFQLERIMRNMLLSPREFNAIRPTIDKLVTTSHTEYVIAVLLDFISRLQILDREVEEPDHDQKSVAQCLEDALKKASKPTLMTSRLRTTRKRETNGEFPCLHVVVTPTRISLEGPNSEQLNRVLRMYPDHWRYFLRVRFADEEQSALRWGQDVDGVEFVKKRVGGILRNGLKIAGRNFEYLGYSSSALKTHTVWFVRPFDLPGKGRQDAATIIRTLGDFSRDSQFPARMGARIAQAFSSTDLSISASVEEIQVVPDIERNQSLFTDGVGTISPEVAKMMWKSLTKLRKKRSYFLPAAYQVRLGGYKGMLAIDYTLEGSVIYVRKSMDKFDSVSLDVEVARAFDRPGPCFLNRPLIMVLETVNKIQPDIFLRLQRQAVREVQETMYTFNGAAKLLEKHGLGASFKLPAIMIRVQNIGLELEHCYALGMKTVLKDAETDILRELKHRARIPVPDSWKLVGIADEFNYLREGEIYACVRDRDEKPIYLEGPYLITRSPVIHPDLYDLINLTAWPELAPRALAEPAEYPPAEKKKIEGRVCNIDDVKDFICDFITSDMVGIIATQHLKLADHRLLGANDPDCLKLAALHSKAVDFPKSGTPVTYAEIPRTGRMSRPDWDVGELGFRSQRDAMYESERALGWLYRDIQLSEDKLQHKGTHPSSRFGMDLDVAAHAKPLPRGELDTVSNYLRYALQRYIHVDAVPQKHFEEAVELLEEYIGELTRICNTYALTSRSVLSEEEVVAGTILERTSQRRRRQDMISEMRTASSSLVANVRDILKGSESDELEEWMLRAWAAYQVARASDDFGRKSFGLLALGNAFDAIEAITQRNLVR